MLTREWFLDERWIAPPVAGHDLFSHLSLF